VRRFKGEGADGQGHLVDFILDAAGQKGTGKWTSMNAADLGVPLTLVSEAVFARCVSSLVDERRLAPPAAARSRRVTRGQGSFSNPGWPRRHPARASHPGARHPRCVVGVEDYFLRAGSAVVAMAR